MKFLNFLKDKPAIKGLIGYYGLSEWWLSEFTEEEKNHILITYTPFGSGADSLLKDDYSYANQSVVLFLSILAGWFNNKRDRYLAIKILEKAELLISNDILIMDIHIFYTQMIKVHYSNRLIDPESLNKSIKACEKQIEIAPQVAKIFKADLEDGFMPSHVGYTQLAIIKKKENKYQAVIEICSKALNEGWRGDWENRINWGKKNQLILNL